MDIPQKVKEKLKILPDLPGCYMMRNRQGRIIYVGKAISLRKRVSSYFRDSSLRQGSPKHRGLVKSVYDLDFIVVKNEAEALLTEGRLIKDYRPRYNVALKDDKRFLLIKADPDVDFPLFKSARVKCEDGALYFGPYTSSASARCALDFVEKRFGLRKCAPAHPDEDTYKHCMNDIIRYCSAPCMGRISRDEYHEHFQEAVAFLRGDRPELLKEVRAKMNEASAALEFEKAAVLRDTLTRLTEVVKKRVRILATPEMKREAAVKATEELQTLLELPERPVLIEGYDISNISGTHAVGSMVCFKDGMPYRNAYRRFRIKTVEGSDDPRMMAEVLERRFSHLEKQSERIPDLIIIDGGITQLRAARRVIDLSGVITVPSVGLAKRYEEIVRDDGRPPVILPRESPVLQMLQRLRDEAHRFAITYHRHLRKKGIMHSELDDIDGVGEKRKLQILNHFGSIRKLMKADVNDIAEIDGIGSVLADTIYSHLHRSE